MNDQADPTAVIFRAGLDHYAEKRDPVDHALDKALPEDPAPVHAVVSFNEGQQTNPFKGPRRLLVAEKSGHEPIFLERFYYQDSLCGRAIKVVLGIPFDSSDPDACERCAEAQRRGATGPPVGRSLEERSTADHEASDRAAQEHADSFDKLHPDDDR
ncbi:hypothetical protein [Kribbella ginsengisoli]|uniref:Uncharacterized protein n=1 Tax=Kribbella ginsengisoli TaxID=363865 RepID=A0ABP6X4H5_9ACTN